MKKDNLSKIKEIVGIPIDKAIEVLENYKRQNKLAGSSLYPKGHKKGCGKELYKGVEGRYKCGSIWGLCPECEEEK